MYFMLSVVEAVYLCYLQGKDGQEKELWVSSDNVFRLFRANISLKYTALYFFLRCYVAEVRILNMFMLFQNSFPLGMLEIKKSKYQELELSFIKAMRITQIVGLILAVLMAVAFFVKSLPISVYMLCSIQTFILLVPLLLIIQEITTSSFIFIRNMNVWHRFKYESHKSYYFTATANLLILSLAIAISFIYDGFYFECFVSEKNLSSGS